MPHQRSSGGLSCVASVLPRLFRHSEDRRVSAPIPSPHFRLGSPTKPRSTLRTRLAEPRPTAPIEAATRVRFLPLLYNIHKHCFWRPSPRYSLCAGNHGRESPRSKKRDCVCRSGPHPKTNSATALNAAGSAYMIHVKPSCVSHRAVLPTAPQLGNWLPYTCSVPPEPAPT